MFPTKKQIEEKLGVKVISSRNPLKSGQCFLQCKIFARTTQGYVSQSPQIGSMFPTREKEN